MLLTRTKKVMLITCLLLIAVIFYYEFYYVNEYVDNNVNDIKYPSYTPHTVPFNASTFPITFDKAKNIALVFLKKKAGVDLSMVKLVQIRGLKTKLALYDGVIILHFKSKSNNHGFIHIVVEASTGRVVYLYMSSSFHPDPSICMPQILSKDYARIVVKNFLEERGFRIDSNINIEINYVNIRSSTNAVFIHYNITIYGHRIYNQRMGDGVLELCISSKRYYTGFKTPFEVLHAYELGLFIKPPDKPPVDKNTALKKAINYLKEKLEINEYEYSFKGLYWYFKTIGKNNDLVLYDPVPRLVYVFKFRIALVNGDQVARTVLIDAITGEVM